MRARKERSVPPQANLDAALGNYDACFANLVDTNSRLKIAQLSPEAQRMYALKRDYYKMMFADAYRRLEAVAKQDPRESIQLTNNSLVLDSILPAMGPIDFYLEDLNTFLDTYSQQMQQMPNELTQLQEIKETMEGFQHALHELQEQKLPKMLHLIRRTLRTMGPAPSPGAGRARREEDQAESYYPAAAAENEFAAEWEGIG